MSAPSSRLLELEQVGDVIVAIVILRKILDEQMTEAIGGRLLGLVKDESTARMVLDFSAVEFLTSVMFGKIIALHRRTESLGGGLSVCGLQPRVQEIFDLLRLPLILHIYDSRQEALQALGQD